MPKGKRGLRDLSYQDSLPASQRKKLFPNSYSTCMRQPKSQNPLLPMRGVGDIGRKPSKKQSYPALEERYLSILLPCLVSQAQQLKSPFSETSIEAQLCMTPVIPALEALESLHEGNGKVPSQPGLQFKTVWANY